MQHICRVIKLFGFYPPTTTTEVKTFRLRANQPHILCDAHASFQNRCILVSLLWVIREQWIPATGVREYDIKKACFFQNNFFLAALR